MFLLPGMWPTSKPNVMTKSKVDILLRYTTQKPVWKGIRPHPCPNVCSSSRAAHNMEQSIPVNDSGRS